MSLIQGNTKVAAAGGYSIGQSARFNRSDSAYLTRTFASDGGDTWTLSVWIKRGQLSTGNNQYWFSEAGGSGIGFVTSTDTLRLYNGSTIYNSTPVYRDPSGWMHVVFSNNAGTWVCYVNGEAVSGFTGTATLFNRNNAWSIGQYQNGGGNYFDGLMSDFYWVSGTAETADAFAETNADGVWVPKAYAGSLTGNSFHLDFSNASSLGEDSGSAGNDWTSSGLTGGSGVSSDQRADTPTNNMMTFNPLNNMRDDGDPTDGNRVFYNTGGTRNLCGTTFHFNTGKYVQAFSIDSAGTQNWTVGLMPSDEADVNDAPGSNEDLNAAAALLDFGTYYVGTAGSSANTGVTVSTADTMWVAYDADSGKQWVGIYDDSAASMVWFNSSGGSTGDPATGANPVVTGTANASLQFAVGGRNSRKITLLEESEATGTVPTGFTYVGALQDTYAAPAITDGSAYFQTTLYSGNGSTQEINQSENSTFQPDWVWIKERNTSRSHVLYDAVRGTTKYLQSNASDAEGTLSGVTSFDADGFTVGSHASSNNSGSTYAAWQWLAANGTASNTDGSITSTVSASTTAGFSAISFVGNGTAGATVGHGLSQKPSLLICKNRDSTEQWIVYCEPRGATEYGLLNSTASWASSSGAWNNTEPTSSVVTLGGGGFGTNVSSNNMIMYAFHSVPGHSFVSSYTGNGAANGPMIYTNGITPKWAIIKRVTGAAEDWQIRDIARSPYNLIDDAIYANSAAAEITGNSAFSADFLSNGIKIRTAHSGSNASGSQYLIWCFGSPFGGSGVAPATAR